jgi:hypothetical protein
MTTAAPIRQPVRSKEYSPPFQRWDSGRRKMSSPVRDGRDRLFHPTFSFAPRGAWKIYESVYPPLKRWAIFGRPYGTKTTGGAQP